MDSLDNTDLAILRILQANSRLTTKEIAQRVNLSTTPVFERLKRLENEGYIKKFVAVLDPDKLNRGFIVFCCIKLRQLDRETAYGFMEMIKNIPEVTECYNISGDFDFLIKVYAPDMKYYRDFILDVIGSSDAIGSLSSMFVMAEVKYENGIPF